MASPDKYVSTTLDDEKYMFVLNHEGRWAAEDLLDKEWPEIAFAYNMGRIGTRIQTAVLFALTRKHHRRKLPDRDAVMRLLEKLDEADDETQEDFMLAMHAAMTNQTKQKLQEDMRKAQEEDEDEPEADEGDESEADEAPKGSEPSTTTKKPSRSRSGGGTSSSRKPAPQE